ncbi:YceI family protein [Kamptonema cortianum]|nr:YceI family protein [Geitlerinema splendidum]MDK3158329.1 YceI family protein [Kamptonema cortianum]
MKKIGTFAVFAMLSASALAQTQTFTVGKGTQAQQIAQVESVTDFETFTGRTDKVTGTIKFDLSKRTGSGTLSIDAASLNTGIPLRDEHYRSETWLNTDKYKTMSFTTTEVKHVRGNEYDVTGKFTMHGVTKTIKTRVTVKHMKESTATKNAGFKGDVLQVKTSFKVKMSDFGVTIPAVAKSKVADTVTISVTVYGQTG